MLKTLIKKVLSNYFLNQHFKLRDFKLFRHVKEKCYTQLQYLICCDLGGVK
jgi:hypothetical protein